MCDLRLAQRLPARAFGETILVKAILDKPELPREEAPPCTDATVGCGVVPLICLV